MKKIYILINEDGDAIAAFSKWEDAHTSRLWLGHGTYGNNYYHLDDVTLYDSQEEFEKDWE